MEAMFMKHLMYYRGGKRGKATYFGKLLEVLYWVQLVLTSNNIRLRRYPYFYRYTLCSSISKNAQLSHKDVYKKKSETMERKFYSQVNDYVVGR